MSEKDIFNTSEEEIKKLANEIRELRNVLGDVSRALSRIETRAKRAFPSAFSKASASFKMHKMPIDAKPTMTTEQVFSLYDELVKKATKEGINQVREQLTSFNLADLNLMRHELGASLGKKKPTQKTLIDAVMSRVNESMKLTHHVNRTELIAGKSTPERSDKENNKV